MAEDLQALIDQVVGITREHLAKTYEHERPAGRCQHFKGLGIKGELLVFDAPKGFRHGVFEEPGRYPIVVRLSNARPRPHPDGKADARGFAIKVFDVIDGSDVRTWDLILATGRGFFVRNAGECPMLASALGEGHPADFFFPRPRDPSSWRVKGFVQAWRASHSGIVDPLEGEYDSLLPFALGPELVVRYIVKPLHPLKSRRKASNGPDHLREAVALRLAVGGVSLGLFVQVGSVRDPRASWSRVASRPVLLGSLEFFPQQLMDDREVEALVFNPGNAPEAHRPLGEINAVRVPAYEASAEFRRKVNGEVAQHGA